MNCTSKVTSSLSYDQRLKDPPLFKPSSDAVELFVSMVTDDLDGRRQMEFSRRIMDPPPGVTPSDADKVIRPQSL